MGKTDNATRSLSQKRSMGSSAMTTMQGDFKLRTPRASEKRTHKSRESCGTSVAAAFGSTQTTRVYNRN